MLNTTCGDPYANGVDVTVELDSITKWSRTIAKNDGVGYPLDEIILNVQEGDEILFIVEDRGNQACDRTRFNPRIEFILDTDGDGDIDSYEIENGTDPNDPLDYRRVFDAGLEGNS